MAAELYPLVFEPIYRPKVWGGRRLESRLGKKLPGEEPVGESWEVADAGADSGVVSNGSLAGRSLRDIFRRYETGLVGTGRAGQYDSFPLLLKFIDASEILSVQVHPDSECAARLGYPGAECKTEAWYILDAQPESRMILGVKEGTTRESFENLLDDGKLEDCLNSFPVARGDVLFVPARTVHAIGKGVLLYEIQECSDTTYRVYDWNRVGLDGKPRELHVRQALESARYGPPGSNLIISKIKETVFGKVAERIRCDSFVLTEYEILREAEIETRGETFHIVSVIEGAANLDSASGNVSLPLGQTVLVPAAVTEYRLIPDGACRVLVSSLPT